MAKQVGFRPSWMGDEPEEKQEAPEQVPAQLEKLREKIAGIARQMVGSGFAKMRKTERMKVVLEFVELIEIENGYTLAVEEKGWTA